jgi:MFS transporter, FSR family, fosmidomycin resistance protein
MIGSVSTTARTTLALACAIHFVHDGFSEIVYVLLPLWAGELGLTLAQAGLLRTTYTSGMALFQIPAGMLAERWGERRLLALGTAVTALGFIAAGWAGGFVSLLVMLLAAGLGSSVQHPLSSSLVSQAWEEGRRRAALGTYNFSGDLGKMAVPAALALVVTAVGWRWSTVAYGLVGLAAAVLIPSMLTGMRPAPAPAVLPRAPETSGRARTRLGDWGIRDSRGFRALSAIGMIDNGTRSGFLILLPFALVSRGASVATVGSAFAILFAGGALGKFVCGLVAERLGVIRTVILTEIATALGILAVATAPGLGGLIALFPLGIGLNGTSSVLYGTVADLVEPERRSRAYGLYYTLSIGASALAPSLFGALGDVVGVPLALGAVGLCVLAIIPLSLVLKPALAVPARP